MRPATVAFVGLLALAVAGCATLPGGRERPGTVEEFAFWDSTRWARGHHPLGLGRFDPENVRVEDGVLFLHLPADGHDGGEVRSVGRVGPGVYEARIRAAEPEGSVTAFFLYDPTPGAGNEVDVEILPDRLGEGPRIMFTTWVGGVETNHVRIPPAELPVDFDLRAFHTYRIEISSSRVGFYIDDVLVQEFTDRIPDARMDVRVNAWWPSWLEGSEDHGGAVAEIDWIRICASCVPAAYRGSAGNR